jgi:hypothetical protein
VENEMSEDRWSAVYYETVDGEEVVENEMKDFGAKSFTRILRTIELLEEFGIGLDEDCRTGRRQNLGAAYQPVQSVIFCVPRKAVCALTRFHEEDKKNSPKRNQNRSKENG